MFFVEFVNYTQDREGPAASENEPRQSSPVELPQQAIEINFDDLMARVRHHVLTNRRRVRCMSKNVVHYKYVRVS